MQSAKQTLGSVRPMLKVSSPSPKLKKKILMNQSPTFMLEHSESDTSQFSLCCFVPWVACVIFNIFEHFWFSVDNVNFLFAINEDLVIILEIFLLDLTNDDTAELVLWQWSTVITSIPVTTYGRAYM